MHICAHQNSVKRACTPQVCRKCQTLNLTQHLDDGTGSVTNCVLRVIARYELCRIGHQRRQAGEGAVEDDPHAPRLEGRFGELINYASRLSR